MIATSAFTIAAVVIHTTLPTGSIHLRFGNLVQKSCLHNNDIHERCFCIVRILHRIPLQAELIAIRLHRIGGQCHLVPRRASFQGQRSAHAVQWCTDCCSWVVSGPELSPGSLVSAQAFQTTSRSCCCHGYANLWQKIRKNTERTTTC